MNLIQRICEKYPIEYTLIPDYRVRTVNLTFGAHFPIQLQDEIMAGLDWLGVFTEGAGLPMMLDVSKTRADSYTLTSSGQEMFHFSNFTGINFPDYRITEAIIWTIYILASRKDWLDPYKGKSISCRCFSARQQAAAVRISSSVTRQFRGSVSDEVIQSIFQELGRCVDPFVNQAPRFSAQPVEESAFEKFKGRTEDMTLQEVARRLFGNNNFKEEVDAYSQTVQKSNLYRNRLDSAVLQLTRTAYELPFVAVSQLFTELGTLIDEINLIDHFEYHRMLQEEVQFSLSAASLKKFFGALDDAYLEDIRRNLKIAFFREVCDKARTLINREFMGARRNIAQLRNALSRFCFVRQSSFEQAGSESILNWKKLSELEDRDVYSKDVSWTPQSFDDLQSTIKSIYAPHLWICSEVLLNQSKEHSITDMLITKPTLIMDERLVWAIWVDV